MRLTYIILPFILFHSIAHSTNALPWKTWKKNTHLKVSYRDVEKKNSLNTSGLIEIKVNAVVDSTLSGFLLFIQDVNNTPNWLNGAQNSEIINQTSLNEHSFFIEISAMWPLKPRMLILHSRFWQNKDLSVDISVNQKQSLHDLDSKLKNKLQDFLIVTVHYAHWHLTPEPLLANPKLNIEYVFVADGAGVAPKWLSNHIALKSIWQSINNLKEQLPKSSWQKYQLPNIKNP
jgi:hypothetical protein